jgi:hypothetical protein
MRIKTRAKSGIDRGEDVGRLVEPPRHHAHDERQLLLDNCGFDLEDTKSLTLTIDDSQRQEIVSRYGPTARVSWGAGDRDEVMNSALPTVAFVFLTNQERRL